MQSGSGFGLEFTPTVCAKTLGEKNSATAVVAAIAPRRKPVLFVFRLNATEIPLDLPVRHPKISQLLLQVFNLLLP